MLYYDAVIAHLSAADEILIFGPGEAKGELKKRLGKDKSDLRILTVETNDKMTESQIVARVRQHFHPRVPQTGANRHNSLTLHQV